MPGYLDKLKKLKNEMENKGLGVFNIPTGQKGKDYRQLLKKIKEEKLRIRQGENVPKKILYKAKGGVLDYKTGGIIQHD